MSRRNYGRPVTRLVPIHAGSSDPSTGTNPTRVRQAITSQTVLEDGRATQALLQSGAPGNVVSFTWGLGPIYPSADEIWFGDLPMIEGQHWDGVNGDGTASAAAFETAFNTLYGYLGWTANAVANTLVISARPRDPQIRKVRGVMRTSPANMFFFSSPEVLPDDVFFGAPEIIS